jgi:hypothetical protein
MNTLSIVVMAVALSVIASIVWYLKREEDEGRME